MKEKFESNQGEGIKEGPFFANPIQALEMPMSRIVEQILPALRAGEYQVIIGEDASGRIPTLVLSKIAEEVYKESGKEKPIVRFFAGSRFYDSLFERDSPGWVSKREALRKALRHIEWRGKALLVTDIVSKGNSLLLLAEILQELGVPYEIATLSLPQDSESKEILERKLNAHIHEGGVGVLPYIFKRPLLAGVKKDPENSYATVIQEDDKQKRRFKNYAREDVEMLAQRIYKRLVEKNAA